MVWHRCACALGGRAFASPSPARADDGRASRDPALSTQALPRLEEHELARRPGVNFAFGQRYPLQLIGLGIGGEGYAGRQRGGLSASFCSPGVSVKGTTAIFSNYGQAPAGMKLCGFWDRPEADVDCATHPRSTRSSARAIACSRPGFPPITPSSSRAACPPASCRPNAARSTAHRHRRRRTRAGSEWEISPCLTARRGALRVRTGAKNRSVPLIDRDFVLQVFGHAIFAPFFDSGHPLYWERNDEPVVRQVLGGEGGVSIPLCLTSCVTL